MKILYHFLTQVVPNEFEHTQYNIFRRMSVTKELMDPIDFHRFFFFFSPQEVNPSTVWLPIFLKISYVLSRRKKFIH